MVSWTKVKLIFAREVRDQLRDRRTIFMIAVLPILLYPLMGMSFLQIAQFMQEHPSKVLVIGGDEVAQMEDIPPLFDKRMQFSKNLFSIPQKSKLIRTDFARDEGSEGNRSFAEIERDAKQAVRHGVYEAVIYFPPDYAKQLENYRESIKQRTATKATSLPKTKISPPKKYKIWFYSASEKSQVAFARIDAVLDKWSNAIGQQTLAAAQLPPGMANPLGTDTVDVADVVRQNIAMWAKILPFIVVIWALTGAFYPAIDLCAGEKERGTLETLLSSPASRTEIVVGKLATIMLFSMVTAVLNLISMGITGMLVVKSLPPALNLGMPPLESIGWLLLALVPLSAMFSALSLALAAFARSTKEGQYYLMPLILLTMPLMIIPMSPGVELTIGNSLIPVTGVALLLRELIQGNFHQAAIFAPAVISVTLLCCLLAIRWAVDQFNSESVLFRESERMDVGLWLKHLRQDRQATPTFAMAMFCGIVLLMIRFVSISVFNQEITDGYVFVRMQSVMMIATIAFPVLLMTIMLTRDFRKTLSLKMPKLWTLPAAIVLAVACHPLLMEFHKVVIQLFPVAQTGDLSKVGAMIMGLPLGLQILVLAVLPALCEELAFRGFILSGLRHSGRKWRAIIISSLFFGITHVILQQSINAAVVGVLIGYLCVQAGSIFPCMLYHVTHNSLPFLLNQIKPAAVNDSDFWSKFLEFKAVGDFQYTPAAAVIGGVVAVVIIWQFHRLKYQKYDEEVLQEAINKQSHPASTA